VFACIAAFACGGDRGDAGGDAPVVATWTVDTVPQLRLGTGDDSLALSEIVRATRLADGGVLVFDRGDWSRHEFDADGVRRGRGLRKGRGPGEMEYLGSAWRCGDTLYFEDIGQRHVLVTALDGTIARRFWWGDGADRLPYASACNADGRFVHYGWELDGREREPPFTVHRDTVPFWLTDADSLGGPRLGVFPGSERLQVEGGSGPLPLGRDTRLAISRHRVYVGTADAWRIAVFAPDGTPLSPLVRDVPPAPLTPDDIDAALAEELAASPVVRHTSIRKQYERTPFNATLPAHGALVVDVRDLLWVQDFPRAGEATVAWHVVDTAGTIVAGAELPSGLVVHEIGADYVLGATTDDVTGAPEVRLLRLERAPRR
jgi:hypothetical protein